MRIEFPLLSILSVAFLLFFALQGGQVELYSLDIGFSADSERFAMTIDPAFVVWSNRLYPNNWLGETFGCVSIVKSRYPGTEVGTWIKRFEVNHIRQNYALGWWQYPAGYFLPIDPQPRKANWSDPSEPDRLEWLPSLSWINLWSFFKISWPASSKKGS